MRDCTFHNNTSDCYFTTKRFQGGSGGLSIGYNANLTSFNSANVCVSDCVFSSNKVTAPSSLSTTTDIHITNIFIGRGGGLSMPFYAMPLVNVVVTNSVFVNNFAEKFGGGLYCIMYGTIISQTYLFENNAFINNNSPGGSGVSFANYGDQTPSTTLHCTIHNSKFENNSAKNGACLRIVPSYYVSSGNFIEVTKCLFHNNTSEQYSAVDIYSFNYYKIREHYEPVNFTEWYVTVCDKKFSIASYSYMYTQLCAYIAKYYKVQLTMCVIL